MFPERHLVIVCSVGNGKQKCEMNETIYGPEICNYVSRWNGVKLTNELWMNCGILDELFVYRPNPTTVQTTLATLQTLQPRAGPKRQNVLLRSSPRPPYRCNNSLSFWTKPNVTEYLHSFHIHSIHCPTHTLPRKKDMKTYSTNLAAQVAHTTKCMNKESQGGITTTGEAKTGVCRGGERQTEHVL